MNISGHWSFFEEFDFGYDIGICVLYQSEESVTGVLVYTEFIEGELPFTISLNVEGELFEDRLVLRGKSYQIELPHEDMPYELDDRAGIVEEDTIIGQSMDDQDLMGDFVLQRLDRLTQS